MKKGKGRAQAIAYCILWILPWVVAAIAMMFLPEQIPVHYGWDGQIDRWGSREEALILPALTTGLGLLIWAGSRWAAKRSKAAERGLAAAGLAILALLNACNLVFLYSCLAQTGQAPSFELDWMSIMFAALGLMLVGLGAVMPKVERNSLVGLRTKWSMKNDRVWQKCQRFGGLTLMAAGGLICLGCLLVFRGFGTFCWTMGLILVMAIADGLYSYQVAKADEAEAQEGNI